MQATAVSGAVQTAKLIIIGPKEAAQITAGEIIGFGSGDGMDGKCARNITTFNGHTFLPPKLSMSKMAETLGAASPFWLF